MMHEEHGEKDIQKILKRHRSKSQQKVEGRDKDLRYLASGPTASFSDIPDVLFDDILLQFKLNRIEVLVLMYLYRKVWCQPNLYQEYGISPMLSHAEVAQDIHISMDALYPALKKLEDLDFISTIRSGQYFVRRYFQKEYDDLYRQSYGDFDV